MNNHWSRTTRYVVGSGLALFWLYILYISTTILPILIIAALTAFLLTPFVRFMHQRLYIPRLVAVILAHFALFLVTLMMPLLLSGPMMQGLEVAATIDYVLLVNNLQSSLETNLTNIQDWYIPLIGVTIDLRPIVEPTLIFLRDTNVPINSISFLPSIDTIVNYVQSAVLLTFGVAATVAGTAFSWIITIIITIMCSIYMTLDAHKFVAYFVSLIPAPYKPEVNILFKRLRWVWQSYIQGQMALMVIIGLATAFGNWMLGVPGALALGVLAGLLELLPYIGPFLAAIPAVIIALLQGSLYLEVNNVTFALMVIGLYIMIQQLENALVIPRVLGHAVRLHPLVVTIGVVVGMSVGGILGALVATPMIASGREIVGYLYTKILGEEPYPIPLEPEPEVENIWRKAGRVWLARFGPKESS